MGKSVKRHARSYLLVERGKQLSMRSQAAIARAHQIAASYESWGSQILRASWYAETESTRHHL